MFAMKEYFCFRNTGPAADADAAGRGRLLRWGRINAAEGGFLAAAGLLYAWLAIVNWNMPLHFDIGDKSACKM
jgi:uncharacterized integral membrane protein